MTGSQQPGQLLHERTRKVIRAIFGGAAGRMFGLIAPFFIMPAMLSYFGVRGFGIWATATSLAAMAGFLDLGVGNAMLTRLAQAFGHKDMGQVRSLLAAGYAALGSVALGLLAVGCALWLIGGPVLELLGISTEPGETAILAATLSGFVLGLPASLIHRVFYARQQVWRSSLWQGAAALLSIVASLSGMRVGLAPGWIALIYALTPVAVAVLATVQQFIAEPEIRPEFMGISWGDARSLLRTGMHFLALSVITSVVMNIDPVLIGWKLGAVEVAHYSVPVKLGSLLMLVVTTLFLPLWAANGEAFARKDYDWIRRNTRKMSLLGAAVVAAVGVVLTLSGNWVILMWMKTAFNGQTGILAAIALFSTVMALTSPYNMVLNSLGQTRLQIVAWAGFGVVSVVAKVILLDETRLWIAPLISAITYAAILMPLMMYGANSALQRRALDGK